MKTKTLKAGDVVRTKSGKKWGELVLGPDSEGWCWVEWYRCSVRETVEWKSSDLVKVVR